MREMALSGRMPLTARLTKAHALKRDRRHCATLLKYKDSQSRQHRNSNPRKISPHLTTLNKKEV